MSEWRDRTFICPHAENVGCNEKDCAKCGWHPATARNRLDKIRNKLASVKPPKIALEHCPLCGGEARRFEERNDRHGVTCTKCSCKVGGYETEREAAMAWNRRVDNG